MPWGEAPFPSRDYRRGMDTTLQLFEQDATGWRRGVYDDIRSTFRAPIVNWIWRTLMANDPDLTRYLWGQVKPIFDTRAFARCSIRYRDAVLSPIEDEFDHPVYRRADIGTPPADYRELRGQLATYDIVAPRLAVLFDVVHRGLAGEPLGRDPGPGRATTEPYPAWLDTDRGLSPTFLDLDAIPAALDGTVTAIQSFHGFDEGLPSIYRTLAQWPGLLEPLWSDAEPILESDAFDRARTAGEDVIEQYIGDLAYSPRLSPADLGEWGLADDRIRAIDDLFHDFRHGPVETVLPTLHLWARAVDVSGERGL